MSITDAEKLFKQPCDFLCAAVAPEHFPSGKRPEIAFIGRSNVGKSSLINALTERKNLARASKTPGRTQQIIFFNLADRLRLADLPGYGHAEAPKAAVAAWNGLIDAYLRKRSQLCCVGLLIDSRHGPLANDLEMMNFLDRAAVSYQIILTKADQLRATDQASRLQSTAALLAKHPAARPEVILTSSEKKTGLEALRTWAAQFAGTP